MFLLFIMGCKAAETQFFTIPYITREGGKFIKELFDNAPHQDFNINGNSKFKTGLSIIGKIIGDTCKKHEHSYWDYSKNINIPINDNDDYEKLNTIDMIVNLNGHFYSNNILVIREKIGENLSASIDIDPYSLKSFIIEYIGSDRHQIEEFLTEVDTPMKSYYVEYTTSIEGVKYSHPSSEKQHWMQTENIAKQPRRLNINTPQNERKEEKITTVEIPSEKHQNQIFQQDLSNKLLPLPQNQIYEPVEEIMVPYINVSVIDNSYNWSCGSFCKMLLKENEANSEKYIIDYTLLKDNLSLPRYPQKIILTKNRYTNYYSVETLNKDVILFEYENKTSEVINNYTHVEVGTETFFTPSWIVN